MVEYRYPQFRLLQFMLLLRLRTFIIASATVLFLLVSFSLGATEESSIPFPSNIKTENEQLLWIRKQLTNHQLDTNKGLETFLSDKKLKAITEENPELLANTSYSLGLYYFNTENYIKAIPTLQSALDNVPNLTYSDSLLLYNNITIAFTSIRAFNSAVQYVGTLEYLIKKNPKAYLLIKNNVMSLDGLYFNLNMYPDAIRIFREKREAGINMVRSDPYKYAVDAFDFGRYFSANKQADSALHYYQVARGIVESSNFKNGDYFLGLIKGNMAEAFIQQEKYDEAIPLLKEHYVASLRVKNLESSAKTLNILAYCEQRTGDIDNALRHLQAVKQMDFPKTDNNILYTNTLYLSQTFGLLNQYDSAYWYSKKYINMTDSIAATRNIKKSAQLSVSVELRHKEQIMQKALVQMHKQQQTAKKNKQTLNWIIGASVLLAISFITVLVLLRQQNKSKQKLKNLLVAHEQKTIEVALNNFNQNQVKPEIQSRDSQDSKPLPTNSTDVSVGNDQTIYLKVDKIFYKIKLSEISYVKSDSNYVEVFLENKKHLVRSTLKNFSELLPTHQFIQVHRSYIVNIHQIESLGDGEVRLIGEKNVPLSANYKDAVIKTVVK